MLETAHTIPFIPSDLLRRLGSDRQHRHLNKMQICGQLPTNIWNVFKKVRRTNDKLVRYQSHLKFNQECLRKGTIPRGMEIKKKPMFHTEIGVRCTEIMKEAEVKIIRETIVGLARTVKEIEREMERLKEELRGQCKSEEESEELMKVIQQEENRKRRTMERRKEKKMKCLIEIRTGDAGCEPTRKERSRRGGRKDGRERRITGPAAEDQPTLEKDNEKGCRRKRRKHRRRKKKAKRKEKRKRKREEKEEELKSKLEEAKEVSLPEDMYEVMDNTNYEWDEKEREVCALGLKFVPTVVGVNRPKKLEDFERFANDLRWLAKNTEEEERNEVQGAVHNNTSEEQPEPGEEDDDRSVMQPWRRSSKYWRRPGEYPEVEDLIETMRNHLFDPNNVKKVERNLNREQWQALQKLRTWNKDESNPRMFRIQDKGSRLVVEYKDHYKEKMEEYLNDERIFREDEADNSRENRREIESWAEKWYRSGHLTEQERDFVTINKHSTPGRIYGNVKVHKQGNPYRFILSGQGTAIENLGRWVEYHLKDCSKKHPTYLKDTTDFLRHLEYINDGEDLEVSSETMVVSRDIVNYYPNCEKPKCIEALDEVLRTRETEEPPIECIKEAVEITMSRNQCEFGGKFYTQIDGATIGGTDSGSITDIFGARKIDKKIQENCPWPTETYMRYRDDTIEITNNGIDTEKDKTAWMNENIDERIKFTDNLDENLQEGTNFLDITITTEEDKEGKKQLVTATYSKPTDTHQYLSPKSCHPAQQTRHIPYGVIHRIRRNASDRVPGDRIFKEQAKMYKAYLLKSGYTEEQINEQFLRITKFKRSTILYRKRKEKRKDDRTKIRFVTDYEPAFPSIRGVLKNLESKINENRLLKKMLPEGARNVQISLRRGGKNIKEMLATTKLNYREERASRTGTCGPCKKQCVHCELLRVSEGSWFESAVTNRRYRIRQNIDCTSNMVVYLVTCTRCNMQGVGSADKIYSRMSNYKTNITNKKRGKCCIEHHFISQPNHSFSDFKFQIIVKLEKPAPNRKEAFKRLRQFEGYWQTELCTIAPNGMNSIDEFHRNRFSQDKAAFS